MNYGDYYNSNGKYLGNDGNDGDGKVYVVTDKNEKKNIKANEKAGNTTSLASVSSAIALPSANVRTAIGEAVVASNSSSSLDTEGGKHEEGVVWGTVDGQETIVNSQSGGAPAEGASLGTEVPLRIFRANNPEEQSSINSMASNGTMQGTAHVHPSGEVNGNEFIQKPSNVDITAQGRWESQGRIQGSSIVVGAKEKRAYIYNGQGVQTSMPLNKFLEIREGTR